MYLYLIYNLLINLLTTAKSFSVRAGTVNSKLAGLAFVILEASCILALIMQRLLRIRFIRKSLTKALCLK